MKKRVFVSLALIGVMLVFGGCLGPEVKKTQLEMREFQTRTYETNDVKMVMKAMLNILQDEGYIVKNAQLDMGLLSAEKTADIESKLDKFFSILPGGDKDERWAKARIIECSANVSEYGNHVRVRVNFQTKVLDNKGGIKEVKQITDENYYQEFFSKVDKGIFIQKEKL